MVRISLSHFNHPQTLLMDATYQTRLTLPPGVFTAPRVRIFTGQPPGRLEHKQAPSVHATKLACAGIRGTGVGPFDLTHLTRWALLGRVLS